MAHLCGGVRTINGRPGDLRVDAPPADGTSVRVQLSKSTAVVVGPRAASVPSRPAQPAAELDPLAYGAPTVLVDQNHSGEVHPMHLHGHRAVVLARKASPPRVARGGSTP